MAIVIADLLPDPVEVKVGKGTISVVGLQLEKIVPILTKYKDDIGQFFTNDTPDMAVMVAVAPDLVADVIAAGADAEGQQEDIKKLPVAAQMEALLAIWELSVPDVKKFRQSLMGAVSAVSLSPPLEEENPSLSTSSTEDTSQTQPST